MIFFNNKYEGTKIKIPPYIIFDIYFIISPTFTNI